MQTITSVQTIAVRPTAKISSLSRSTRRPTTCLALPNVKQVAGAAAAALLMAQPAWAHNLAAEPVALVAEVKEGNLKPEASRLNNLGTPLSSSRYTGTLSGDEMKVREQREMLNKSAENKELGDNDTRTNTLLDPYGIPSNKNKVAKGGLPVGKTN